MRKLSLMSWSIVIFVDVGAVFLVTRVWFADSLIYLELFSRNKRLLVKAVKYFGEFFGAFFFMKKKLVQYSGGYVYAFYNTQIVFERALEVFEGDRVRLLNCG